MTDRTVNVAIAAADGATTGWVSIGRDSGSVRAERIVHIVWGALAVTGGLFFLYAGRRAMKQKLAVVRNGPYPPDVKTNWIASLERNQPRAMGFVVGLTLWWEYDTLGKCYLGYQECARLLRSLTEVAEIASHVDFNEEFPLARLTETQVRDESARQSLAALRFGEVSLSHPSSLQEAVVFPTKSAEKLAALLILHFTHNTTGSRSHPVIKQITIPAPLNAETDGAG
jgi:hypothetical protein